jgi:hypothetical protein
MQYNFGFPIRTALRLGEIEDILRQTRVLVPIPSRPKLIALCEEGKLEGRRTEFGWIVYEDSFKAWVRTLQQDEAAA